MRRSAIAVAASAIIALSGRAAAAQSAAQQVRDLYASAAYEDALSLVAEREAAEPNPELSQYRIFCLVALGRLTEAERAVETMIDADPLYHASDASPRIRELFAQVRRRRAPGIVRRMYADGKAALDRRDRAAAVAAFELMLRVTEDPDVRDDTGLQDLKLLGAGFLDLSRALPAAPPSSPVPAEPPPTSTTSTPVNAPAQVSPPIPTPPVAVHEKLPVWIPRDPDTRNREFRGAVRVEISAEGTVVRAEMMTPVHPSYDVLLLRAARDWIYQPARVNGVPVPSERVVQVRLIPRP